jgi:hypothetical protein
MIEMALAYQIGNAMERFARRHKLMNAPPAFCMLRQRQ